MKRAFVALLAVLQLTLLAAALRAQSAESIIDGHLKAIGGAKAARGIRATRYAGTLTAGAGHAQGTFVWQTQAPGSFYQELRWSDSFRLEACKGKTSWREDPRDGLRTLTGPEANRAKAYAFYRNDHFLNYRKEKTRARLLGRKTVGGRAAYAVEVTTRLGVKHKVFFYAENYLILQEEFERDDGPASILYSDYRPVDGVREPFHLVMHQGAETLDIQLSEVVHNAGVSPAVFDFPRRSGAPPPDPIALLKEVEKNQKKIDEIRENYTYTLTQTDIEIDGKGNIKQKSENVYEVFHAYGWGIEKLVQKNGRKLTPDEERKEQERVQKVIQRAEKWKKEEPSREAKKEKERARKKKHSGDGDEDDDDDIGIDDFLRISQITNPRRERFRGQEVLVFEFEPRPNYKPKNRAESLVQKLTGSMWIDENAKEVVRLEARLLDSFKVGGGLVASLARGSTMVFEQERVHNEIWLPSYAEADLSARLLLVAGMKMHRMMRFSDYKKFSVDSRQEIRPPPPPPK